MPNVSPCPHCHAPYQTAQICCRQLATDLGRVNGRVNKDCRDQIPDKFYAAYCLGFFQGLAEYESRLKDHDWHPIDQPPPR